MTDFGSDISCAPDLNPTFATITGNRVLAEALVRRLTTPRGTLVFHPDYGIDVRQWLCESMDKSALAQLAQLVETECHKDERVDSAKATVGFIYSTGFLEINIHITTAEGPFKLALFVNKLSVDILE